MTAFENKRFIKDFLWGNLFIFWKFKMKVLIKSAFTVMLWG